MSLEKKIKMALQIALLDNLILFDSTPTGQLNEKPDFLVHLAEKEEIEKKRNFVRNKRNKRKLKGKRTK